MPPHWELQTSYGPNALPVEMSPGTMQVVGDGFDTTMPPPLTPRQGAASFIRSPDAIRTGLPSRRINTRMSVATSKTPCRSCFPVCEVDDLFDFEKADIALPTFYRTFYLASTCPLPLPLPCTGAGPLQLATGPPASNQNECDEQES